MTKSKLVSYVNLNCNKIRVADYEKLLDLSVSSCEQVADIMKKAVKTKIMSNINSFYFK
jgi:hypothetical protein